MTDPDLPTTTWHESPVPQGESQKTRYLVCHDYGMGALWWWVHARSATEIMERVADVLVNKPGWARYLISREEFEAEWDQSSRTQSS